MSIKRRMTVNKLINSRSKIKFEINKKSYELKKTWEKLRRNIGMS